MARFDLNLLFALDALLRRQNVTNAADEVGVSQSTMSGMLTRLREQLGDRLLVRVGTGYELTDRAKRLAGPVRQLHLSIGELVRPEDDFDLARSQRYVRIMASEFSQLLILPSLFRTAASMAPGLRFEVLPISDPIAQVSSGDVDLCLSGVPLDDLASTDAEQIRTRTIFEQPFVGLVARDHPLRGSVSIDQLRQFPYISTLFPGVNISVEQASFGTETSMPPPVIYVPSFLTGAAMVAGTDRVCIVPARLASTLAAEHNLATIGLPGEFKASSLRMLWHNRHAADPVHHWMRATVIDACAELKG